MVVVTSPLLSHPLASPPFHVCVQVHDDHPTHPSFSPTSVPAQLSSFAPHPTVGPSTSATVPPPLDSAFSLHGNLSPYLPFIAPSHLRNRGPPIDAHHAHTSPSIGCLVPILPASSFNGPNLYSYPHTSPLPPQTLAYHNLVGPSHTHPVTIGPTLVGSLRSSNFGDVSYARQETSFKLGRVHPSMIIMSIQVL